jgi:uncharacterized protein (AIM24 family)
MTDFWGSDRDRTGSYVGAPTGGGFGRKKVEPSSTSTPSYSAPVAPQQSYEDIKRRVAEDFRAEKSVAAGPVEIDYIIGGSDIQHIEIELDPGEAVVAENGSMIWKDDAIEIDLVMGDGRDDNAGFVSKVINAGSNVLAGESFYLTQFKHKGGSGKARVVLGGKVPGQILPIRLTSDGPAICCQRDSFLAAAKGIAVSAKWGDLSDDGFMPVDDGIMQTLSGDGWAFIHVGGSLIERELGPGEMIQVDGGCVAAREAGVRMSVRRTGGFGASVAGGEGFLVASLCGPGKVWIQTMPFHRIANAIVTQGQPQESLVGSAVSSAGGKIGTMAAAAGAGFAAQHIKENGWDVLKGVLR